MDSKIHKRFFWILSDFFGFFGIFSDLQGENSGFLRIYKGKTVDFFGFTRGKQWIFLDFESEKIRKNLKKSLMDFRIRKIPNPLFPP
jgi:hypothetical protein